MFRDRFFSASHDGVQPIIETQASRTVAQLQGEFRGVRRHTRVAHGDVGHCPIGEGQRNRRRIDDLA